MSTPLCRAHEAIRTLLRAEAQAARTPQGDKRYDELRLEIDRAQEMTGETTDWPRVLQLGRALLGDGHEDLRIAAYTARAAQTVDALGGFVFGLALFTELIGPRWATLSPPPGRLRARASALRWWVHAASQLLQQAVAEPAITTEEFSDIAAAIDALRERARAHLGNQTPALGELKREWLRLRERGAIVRDDNTEQDAAAVDTSARPTKSRQPAPELKTSNADPDAGASPNTPANPPPEVAQPLATAAASVPSASASAPSDSDLPRQLKRTGQELIELASRLRRQNIRDPRAYNVLRHGLWLHLEALPPATEGKSQIPPIVPSATRQLKALEMRAAWADLIDFGERLLVRHRLDLDLQRMIATALTSLDPPAKEAAAAIRTRTVELLERFPGLLDLHCRDGAALADTDTRAWLVAGRSTDNLSVIHNNPTERGHTHTSKSDSTSEHQHGHTSESSHDGVQASSHNLAHTGTSTETQGQASLFIARLQLAEDALRNGNTTFAAALFAGLEAMVDRHKLERWRPDLAKRVLVGALRAQADTPVVSARAQRLGALCPQALAEFMGASATS